ncbi:MAG: PAS domain S-box protein [Planctomycetota bacterium]|nr:PAS domain S-box protein [Planctomycetota bacterium]
METSPQDNWAAAAFQVARDGLIVSDLFGKIVAANPAAELLLGYGPQELVGLRLMDLIPPRYRTAHAAGMDRVRSSGNQHLRGPVALEALHKQGHEVHVELVLGEIPRDGNRFAVASLRDATHLRRAERALDIAETEWTTILNALPFPVLVSNADAEVKWASIAFTALVGLGKRQAEGLVVGDLVLAADGNPYDPRRPIRGNGTLRTMTGRRIPAVIMHVLVAGPEGGRHVMTFQPVG